MCSGKHGCMDGNMYVHVSMNASVCEARGHSGEFSVIVHHLNFGAGSSLICQESLAMSPRDPSVP